MSEQVRHPPGLVDAAPAVWRAWLPSWPWIVGLLAMLRALASPLALLNDPDTYMHIAAGRWMLTHAALPAAEPFSFTMAGQHWVPGEWLGEVVLAAVYAAAGWGGVIVLSAAGFGLAVGLLARFLARRLDAMPAVIAALAGAVLVLPHLLARPHVLALPLLVLWCGALFAARDDNRAPPWALLPVMLCWANLHGSFLFGIALALYLAAEAVLAAPEGTARRHAAIRWGGFILAAAALCVVNPNGPDAIVQPFRLMAMPALQSGFGEWQPADLVRFPALAAWLLGAGAVVVLGWRALPWTRLALLAALAYMALAHVRHADLLGLVGPLVIAAPAAPRLAMLLRPAAGSPVLRAAALFARPARLPALCLVIALALAAGLPSLMRPVDRTGDAVTPAAALAAARAMNLTGPVFNSEAFGGYLIFAGVPTFIDGRIELYGNAFLAGYLAAERGDAAALAGLLDRYRIGWTLVQAQAPMAAALDRLSGWRRVYADGRAVIHVRQD
ncbi:MAG TPA: hypothetical protein VG651_07525 [Stellaceae bacterium]|nr:hypothetical protein [Stellaceae bacterium]